MEKSIEFNLKLKDFEGPLDLLDTLIRQKKMDILNLDVAAIAEQYLAFIDKEINTISIDDASEYLEMSIYLISLKSKKVIPIELEATGDSSFEYERDKLIQRILEYRKYKEVVTKLEQKREDRLKFFSKMDNDIEQFVPDKLVLESLPEKIDVNKLLSAINSAINKYQMSLYIQKKIFVQELSINEVKDELWKFLLENKIKEISFSEYLGKVDSIKLSKQFIVTTFLALLDLTKYHKINLIQKFDKDNEFYIKRIGDK